jgi:hypothetical protein
MDKADRIRTVYLHTCLRYVNREFLTNTSVRQRFAIEPQNSAIASRLIREALDAGVVVPQDVNAPPKLMRYVPAWAGPTTGQVATCVHETEVAGRVWRAGQPFTPLCCRRPTWLTRTPYTGHGWFGQTSIPNSASRTFVRFALHNAYGRGAHSNVHKGSEVDGDTPRKPAVPGFPATAGGRMGFTTCSPALLAAGQHPTSSRSNELRVRRV